MKRTITLLLALLLILAPMNVAIPASAAELNIESTVRTSFRDFVKTLNPGDGVNDAVMEVFNHTIFGGGKNLNLDKTSAFTGLILSANVYEDGLVDGLTAGFESMLSTGSASLSATGKHTWTEANKSYSYTANGSVLASVDNYTGSLNACDDAMVTVARNADASFTITRNPVTDNTNSYTVSVQISSTFDIKTVDGSKIDNAQIQEGLKWVQRMQKIGLGGKPFKWIVTAEFTVSFPAECTHSFSAWTNRDADTHIRTCANCKGEQIAAHSWDAGKTSDDGVATTFTCAACAATKTEYNQIIGTWETDIVFPAADLGVQAEDIRFRCTLNFTKEGVVTANWTSVELTAIKLYFHQMFVNSYYACAYAAGYTELEAIEAMCMESTGKSVSDYMMSFLDGFDMKAMFTPAPAGGTYTYSNNQLFWDLKLMELTSDPAVANPCTIDGNTMNIKLVSHGNPDYTMVCTKVN